MNLLLRDSWQEAWQQALDLVSAALRGADVADRCRRAGALWDPHRETAEVLVLGRPWSVAFPTLDVTVAGGAPAPLKEKVFILRYLSQTLGTQPSGAWIGFEQHPDGRNYVANFQARVVGRLVGAFAGREDALSAAVRALGGRAHRESGDVAAIVPALPRVPLMLQLFRGDDEFPPGGNVLFDATVADHLSAEDAVVAGELTVCAVLRQGGGA